MTTALSGASLYINNEIVPYMSNSLKFVPGKPERKVDPQVVGDGNVENVATEDFSTAKSKVVFDLKTTIENETLYNAWHDLFDANLIKIISKDGTSRIYENCTIINQPEFDTGSDGVASIEFEGAQSVFG